MAQTVEPLAVELRNIDKVFASSNVRANQNVSLQGARCEIHAICGENGAGKSTLMNILYGLMPPDSGKILVDGVPLQFASPADAIAAGIGMVHQHFKVVSSFTVAENVLLGIERTRYGLLDRKDETRFVRQLAQRYDLPIDPGALVATLPVGLQQRVEILKMLARRVRILILDEPTAMLTPGEVEGFLKTIRKLAEDGCTIFFISHKLHEVMSIADRVTIMKKGTVVGTRHTIATSVVELANMMVGRDVVFRVEKSPLQAGRPVLEVDRLSVRNQLGVAVISDVSFTVRAGEIYGIAGVAGNGQEALMAALTGLTKIDRGRVKLEGKQVGAYSVMQRKASGMAHIPEDRIQIGLNMATDIKENCLLGYQRKRRFRRRGFIDQRACRTFAREIIQTYSVAGARPEGPVAKLSGGNMQKIVLGRELSSNPSLIVANQPTRGLDVGSIEFVHTMLLNARDSGVAVVLVAVELEEIIALSDTIGVLFRGRIQGELSGAAIDREKIGLFMAGGS